MPPPRFHPLFLVGLILSPAASLVAPAAATAQPETTELELLIEVRRPSGRLLTDLSPGDLTVEEDGQPAAVVSVRRLVEGSSSRPPHRRSQAALSSHPWHFVLYFDGPLLTRRSRRVLAEALSAQAGELTAMGRVEVVVADPHPKSWLGPTRDPKLLRATLERVLRTTLSSPTLAEGRRQFRELRTVPASGSASATGWDPARTRGAVREASGRERQLVEAQLEALRWWLGTYSAAPPKALIWVSDSFDLHLQSFYLAGLPRDALQLRLAEDLSQESLSASTEEAATLVGALGWTVLPLWQRWRRLPLTPDVRALETTLVTRPEAALESFASLSGGAVLLGEELERALAELSQRYLLRYRVARAPDNSLHRIEVRARNRRLVVEAPPWRAQSTAAFAAPATAIGSTLGKQQLETSCHRLIFQHGGQGGSLPSSSGPALPSPPGIAAPAEQRQRRACRDRLRSQLLRRSGAGRSELPHLRSTVARDRDPIAP